MAAILEQINRKNPTFFLFLVDQSGSMSEPFAGQAGVTKAHGVAQVINRLVDDLVVSCSNGTEILDRFYLGLIGYNDALTMGFGGALQGRLHVPISEVGNNLLKIETHVKTEQDASGRSIQTTVKVPIWIEATAKGRTHMREALEAAKDAVADFVAEFPRSRPPIVINITDGIPTDARQPDLSDVEAAARDVQSVANQNGNRALLFNIHVSAVKAAPILYPVAEAELSEPYSKLLFRMSSPLTGEMCRIANMREMDIRPGARGIVYQADMAAVIDLLDIGTRGEEKT